MATALAFLTSTRELPGGGHEREIPAKLVWAGARKLGLSRADYGRTWFVHESKQDYLDSLD
jgi:hypothetical protein